MSDSEEPATAAAVSTEPQEEKEEAEGMDATPTPPDTSTGQSSIPDIPTLEPSPERQQPADDAQVHVEIKIVESSVDVPSTPPQEEDRLDEAKGEDLKAGELQAPSAVVELGEPAVMDDSEGEPELPEGEERSKESVPGREEDPPKVKSAREDAGKEEASHPTPSSAEDYHVYHKGWSKLSREELVDRIKGVIYGQAIGDAFGLATEFMDRKMAQKVYGKAGPSSYQEIAQDFHRMRWQPGDWTDDTDQMLLILQGIVENNGVVGRLDFAKRIQHWMGHGFPDLGDYGGMGIGMTVHRTLSHHAFLKDPHAAAREVWERSGRYLAANGAIMRTSILGVLNFNDLKRVEKNTKEISQCTHADPRCTASCMTVTLAIAMMLQGVFDPKKDNELKSLIDACLTRASKALELPDQVKEMRDHVLAPTLEKLKLDEAKSIGYTFKALGAGFYGLRTTTDFRQSIKEVIMQAGDADSNGAVCGALMGCKLGFKALPHDLLAFQHREWLDTWVDRFLRTIGLQETPLH